MHQVEPETNSVVAPLSKACTSTLQMTLVAHYGAMIARESNLDVILQKACEIAAGGVGAKFTGVLQYRADQQDFVLQAGVGWQDRVIGRARFEAGLDTTAGLTWHTRQPIRFRQLLSHRRVQAPAALTDHGVHRMVSVPIHGDAEFAFGVLEVGSTEEGEFAGHDVAFLQALANSIAAAVDRQADRASRAEQAAMDGKQTTVLDDIQHRLSNDLQWIYGLAALEARRSANPEHYGSRKRGARHTLALANLYEHLRYQPQGTSINFGVYLHTICQQIARTEELQAHQVTLVIELPSLSVDPEKAVRLAIAVNELITDAARHAFLDGQCVSISVRLRPGGHGKPASLTVSDDGCGFAGSRVSAASLGIVERLVRCAGSTLSHSSVGGTDWTITLDAGEVRPMKVQSGWQQDAPMQAAAD